MPERGENPPPLLDVCIEWKVRQGKAVVRGGGKEFPAKPSPEKDPSCMSRQSAGVNGKATRLRRSDRFLAGLEGASLVTFVSHVNPDPDSLGSMLGLAYMVEACLGK